MKVQNLELYQTLVSKFKDSGISFSELENGFAVQYSHDHENYIAKLLQDFYHLVGYNVLLLNQNGNCRVCLEFQGKDAASLLRDIEISLDGYVEQIDYVSLMDRDVKATYSLFKKSFMYPGNFGIGVKNLAEAYN